MNPLCVLERVAMADSQMPVVERIDIDEVLDGCLPDDHEAVASGKATRRVLAGV